MNKNATVTMSKGRMISGGLIELCLIDQGQQTCLKSVLAQHPFANICHMAWLPGSHFFLLMKKAKRDLE